MALAPMPLFAAYGLLTALMIMMALVATLAVLPSMLMVVTADRVPAGVSTSD
jgi:predicted RND superfamily exporter protein